MTFVSLRLSTPPGGDAQCSTLGDGSQRRMQVNFTTWLPAQQVSIPLYRPDFLAVKQDGRSFCSFSIHTLPVLGERGPFYKLVSRSRQRFHRAFTQSCSLSICSWVMLLNLPCSIRYSLSDLKLPLRAMDSLAEVRRKVPSSIS